MDPKNGIFVGGAGTLGWIEHIFFTNGAEEARRAFFDLAPDARLQPYTMIRSDQGSPALRTDITKEDAITYLRFNPPPLWAIPLSLMRIQLQHRPKNNYVTHQGEEILIPTRGIVTYSLFWSEGKDKPGQEKVEVGTGQIARLNSLVPHHGWASQSGGAEAWIAIYHRPDSSGAFDVETRIQNVRNAMRRKQIESEALKKPGQFALLAWGIAERIRSQRQRAGLTIAQMSELAQLDSSYLSRIENSDANISVEMLLSICKFLKIDVTQLIAPSITPFKKQDLPKISANNDCRVCLESATDNVVGVRCRVFSVSPKQQTINPLSNCKFASWIVMDGRVIVEAVSPKYPPEVLEAGGVMHFREALELRIQPLQPSRIVELTLENAW